MAAGNEAVLMSGNGLPSAAQLGSKLMLLAGVAAVVAVMVVFWLWSQQPDYRILFSNYSDKDGGSIVAALEKMNVPYKFSESGSAILVPADQVHTARLKLASEGLPKGGNIGFELLENQKFGVSQFVEQVNFQRALEGELERSIQAIAAVQVARIHLAIPKPSVFVRDQQNPTASVLLNLHPGRTLDPQQVAAVVHLVASSVPNLPAANVTVVDQNGNLLSDTSKKQGANGLDQTQIKYVEDMQASIARRVESIITPLVGAKNVRAEASAEIDFSTTEQAAETYKPNFKPEESAVRSMQSNESSNGSGADASGVPGALSNQPPPNSTAPIDTTADAGAAASAGGVEQTNKRESTTNYEVDKTVKVVRGSSGAVKRLSAAVVVNYQSAEDKGKTVTKALTPEQIEQMTALVRETIGFNRERGDSVNLMNTPFQVTAVPTTDIPLWKQPEAVEYGKDGLRFLVGVVVLFLVYTPCSNLYWPSFPAHCLAQKCWVKHNLMVKMRL